jgi:dTMP kinase
MISVMPQDSQTGFFVSFEGSEGCGKSTQIRLLVNRCLPQVPPRRGRGRHADARIFGTFCNIQRRLPMEPETELLLPPVAQLVWQGIRPEPENRYLDRFLTLPPLSGRRQGSLPSSKRSTDLPLDPGFRTSPSF